MELRTILFDVNDHVATVTLNRPHRSNAWTGRMHAEYRWCLKQANDDPGVRVVVVTGAERAFCVGGDSDALAKHAAKGDYDSGIREEPANPGYGVDPRLDHDFAWHWGLRVPVIAAINGACAGVGLSLACFCDLRYTTTVAKFTTAAPKLGLPAEYGLSFVLPRILGTTVAADLLLTGRIITGDEAKRIGLVNDAVAPEDFTATVAEAVERFASGVSPAAVAVTKRQLYRDLLHHDVGNAVDHSIAVMRPLMAGPEYREGVAALQEKRPPRF